MMGHSTVAVCLAQAIDQEMNIMLYWRRLKLVSETINSINWSGTNEVVCCGSLDKMQVEGTSASGSFKYYPAFNLSFQIKCAFNREFQSTLTYF